MSALSARDFAEYFEGVHGVAPFRWQEDLARHVLDGGWPQGIDVPTGMGKTAVIDIAVFALAVQAGLPLRTAPTRTFVVVDRRLIVDQAHLRADLLVTKLQAAPPDSVVGRVAARLRTLAGGGVPLVAVRMRGGTTWGWRWLARPSQPAVVLATVDQFGSRVLFRGYGVGRSLRPIDAALCGADSLLILDEAHLSQALVETLRCVHSHEGRAELPVLADRRPQPVLLSATLPAGVGVFRPDLDIETSEVARARLDARRVVHLLELATRKDPLPELAAALAALARAAMAEDGVERVAVVCNTVQLARSVFELLAAEEGSGVDCVLLVGRCRQYERDLLGERWLPRLAAQAVRPPARPIIAVATQTIEVGADLDVDVLITEASPLDALLQRLGRLNRFGLRASAAAFIVHAAARHDDDPVYGAATGRTWDRLVEQAGVPTKVTARRVLDGLGQAPALDLGPRALAALLDGERRDALAAEPSLAPVVLGPTLRAWARTSPAPEPDQEVAPYLHGIARPASEVQICWRAGLPQTEEALEVWREELRTAPVSAYETVSVPLWEAKRFLRQGPIGEIADIEGAPARDEDIRPERAGPSVFGVVVTADGHVVVATDGALRPGVTLVVPANAGGHDEWGWAGKRVAAPPVADVADLAPRRRPRLRLRAEIVGASSGTEEGRQWREAIGRCLRDLQGDAGLEHHKVLRILEELPAAVERALPSGLRARVDELRGGSMSITSVGYGTDNWILVEGRARSSSDDVGHLLPDVLGDEDDLSSSAAPRAVTLEQHLWDVAREAERQGQLLGLAPVLVAAVELAARAHDLGKAEQRFQAMLNGGDELAALARSEPLAKSGMDPKNARAFHAARRRSGWPSGMRHEAISAALLRRLASEHEHLFADVDVELVHHLVQTHHGRGRPLLPPVMDHRPDAVSGALPGTSAVVTAQSDDGLVDWDGPARFDRLGRRYGWWGLALLESIVRLADIAVSEAYDRERSA